MALCTRVVNIINTNFGNHYAIRQFSSSSSTGPRSVSELLRKFCIMRDRILHESAVFMRFTLLQVDYIATNRLKRMNSLYGLYNRLYEKEKLKELLKAVAKNLRCRSTKFVLGATMFHAFDWEEHTLKQADIDKYSTDIQSCLHLTQTTLTCGSCGFRLKIDKAVEGVKYCQCKDAPASVYGVHKEKGDWAPFLEKKDIIVWRKEHPSMKGMYLYKMYGRFDDVSAEDFMRVQLDMSEFRLTWDSSTAQCFVLDSNAATGQEVYYWEVNWPRFFSNRDYCCIRQTYRDAETGVTVLVSRSTEHPHCQLKRKCLRVEDYDSVLMVKPFDTPDRLGMEFCLTGFENPGVQLPESIITWVAIRGMPEFMHNLRLACIKLRNMEDPVKPSLSPALNRATPSTGAKDASTYNVNATSRMYA